nr:NAD(P)H-hydrate dehydratase [Gammaproteobacteria bacterium]
TARSLLPRRSKDTHKGNNGHVLVIGGDYGMGGAVRLASEAAARVGSGLVTVATRPEHVTIVSGSRPEIMCHQVTCREDLLPLLERATVVAIGPGLGKGEWGRELLEAVVESQLPMVLDADGLNILSEKPFTHEQWVLTPHPGEAARLLGISNKEIQADRFTAISHIIEKYHGVCVLKGAGTLVKSFNQSHELICPAGNPGMATGGMGDILSGVIAGFVAQGLSLAKAAEIGVLVHSVAGDMAAEKGGERGLLATDLMDFLRELVNP